MQAFSSPTELQAYADVIVRVGVNLQTGQRLLVRADLQTVDLVRAVTRSAYRAGARFVDVVWNDEQLGLVRLQEASRDSLEQVAAWQPQLTAAHLAAGDPLVSIYAATPTLFAGQDPEAVSTTLRAAARASKPASDLVQRNAAPWVVVSYPTPGWAAAVLPAAPEASQLSRLWHAIAATCRLDQPDPVAAWQQHVQALEARAAYMNERRYAALHFSGPGTDLTVGLVADHLWAGGGAVSEGGIPFVPNLPTEEIFTLPHHGRADGFMRSSRPLNYGGELIDDFTIHFSQGRVSDLSAARGEATLRRLIETDPGAARLGEVALVAASSPVGRTGLLFANTLFDENAASHLALGNGYRACVRDGNSRDDEQFAALGGNLSVVHVDFMLGCATMDVDGIYADDSSEAVMRGGEWVF
ncbi:MAG: aminopeptidase [Candidatus Viridilinea halotolerans]|uniref:Aminopeptidase n=1 Tax=Candidatus Viridilinea halotolerans TaxID=2491704 RepID=A0A426TQW7_9CHLR|nr:MAG: aminopeptidase [Candidatus Viridilinea halotolerans]